MKRGHSVLRISDAVLLNPFFFWALPGRADIADETLTIITNKMIDCRRYIEPTAHSVQFPNGNPQSREHAGDERGDDAGNHSYEPDIVRSGGKTRCAGRAYRGVFCDAQKTMTALELILLELILGPGTGIAICMRSQQWNTTARVRSLAQGELCNTITRRGGEWRKKGGRGKREKQSQQSPWPAVLKAYTTSLDTRNFWGRNCSARLKGLLTAKRLKFARVRTIGEWFLTNGTQRHSATKRISQRTLLSSFVIGKQRSTLENVFLGYKVCFCEVKFMSVR